MQDMMIFAQERHWHEHTGLPQMTEENCFVSDDETCLLHEFRCHICDEVVQISESISKNKPFDARDYGFGK